MLDDAVAYLAQDSRPAAERLLIDTLETASSLDAFSERPGFHRVAWSLFSLSLFGHGLTTWTLTVDPHQGTSTDYPPNFPPSSVILNAVDLVTPPEEVEMPGSTVKQKVLEAIEKLPADATLEDAIERLVLLAKIERGLAELDAGQGVEHSEAKRRLIR